MHVSIVNDLVECQQPPGKHHKTRAVSALSQHGKTWLADVIANCKKGKRCGIIFCGSCRHRFAKEAEQRMLEHVQGRIQRDGPDAEKELRFLTVLLDVVYPASVKKAVEEARRQLKAFAKEFPNVWMQGAFEFEMINLRLLFAKKGKNRKCEVIKSMLNWGGFQGIPIPLPPEIGRKAQFFQGRSGDGSSTRIGNATD